MAAFKLWNSGVISDSTRKIYFQTYLFLELEFPQKGTIACEREGRWPQPDPHAAGQDTRTAVQHSLVTAQSWPS